MDPKKGIGKTQMKCFKAYDIRGHLGDELTDDIAYRIGRAFGEYLHPKAVALGGDVRPTSESLKQSLAKGLKDAGSNVLDLGMVGTEEIYFAAQSLDVDGAIEVTASHNPIDYNGMKLVLRGGVPISGDSGLRDIEKLAEQGTFPDRDSAFKGSSESLDNRASFVDHLMEYVDLSAFRPLRLVVNAGNGMAGPVIDAIEKRFQHAGVPVEFIKVHHQPDGTFPHGIPNPLLPENRASTAKAVVECGADIGIAWDGDFDRCFFYDEKGNFIEGYYLVGLLAHAFLVKFPGAKIIHDPRLTWNTIDIVKKAGGVPIQSKTGHAFIKERMRAEDAVYGGEMSAHHYFRDFGYCDSGMIPWLLVAELLCRQNIPLSAMVRERIEKFPASGEINSRLKDAPAAIARVRNRYESTVEAIDTTDGISMEFDTWRFNLRSSNTEPVVRLNVESRGDVELMREKTAEILGMLRE
jgi:phosphomannomutase